MPLVRREEARLDCVCLRAEGHAGPQRIVDTPARRERQRRIAPKPPGGLRKSEMLYPGNDMQPGFEPTMTAVGQMRSAPGKKRPRAQVARRSGSACISESKTHLAFHSEP